MLGISLASSVLFLAPALPQEPPPGLVLVKGGRTKVGTAPKDVEAMILEFEQFANTFAGETPRHEEKVDDFYLMPNEVTNEQYAEYVSAMGAQPPYYWGREALEAGRMAFLEEEGQRIQAARAEGKRPDRRSFDPSAWWDENWTDAQWEVPEEELDKPVVYISFSDAEGYARWAGVRLMTEIEYTRAARRDTDRTFPWGDEWDDREFTNSLHLDRQGSMPVGSFPKGAAAGIYDLSGNVWEWTASPYRSFDGYKLIRVKVGRGRQAREIEAMAGFDPNMRVLVSGSYAQTQVGVRIATRMPADRFQRTEALGFRCAADVKPGKTAAEWLVSKDVNMAVLPPDIEFYTDGAVVLRRWMSKPGSVKMEGYGVVTGFEKMLFCPVLSVPASSKAELARQTLEGPAFLGLVALSHPIAEPEMDGGTFLLAWRGAGKLKGAQEEEEETTANLRVEGRQDTGQNFWEVDGFDAEADCFFFYDLEGKPVVAFPATELEFKRMAEGSVKLEPFVPPAEEEIDPEAPPIIPMDTLRFSLAVAGKTKSKGILFDLPIKVRPGTIDDSWR